MMIADRDRGAAPQNSQECPCEAETPVGAPGPVFEREHVIRVAAQPDWVVPGPGNPGMTIAAFSRRDLEAREAGRNASVFRDSILDENLAARARDIAKTDAPVYGTADVIRIRSILDDDGRREFCVNADPIQDSLGKCPEHSGIVRTKPLPDGKDRVEWQIVRLKLARIFDRIGRCSIDPPKARSLLPGTSE